MNLTEHFTLEELTYSAVAENKHIDNTPNTTMINEGRRLCYDILEPIRQRYGKPIIVTSGYRCPLLNKVVGGAKNSDHRYFNAADIKAKDGNNKELWNIIIQMIKEGKIICRQLIDEYNLSWIHISNNNKYNSYRKNQIIHIV